MASKEFFQNHVIGRVIDLEGGLSLNKYDSGNWTGRKVGVGELKGTKFGISAASFPHEDIPNLTQGRATELYYEHYWLTAGCDQLENQLAFVHFDSAVQHGVSKAMELLRASRKDLFDYLSQRFDYYTRLKHFYIENDNLQDDFGKGWIRRMAQVLAELTDMEEGVSSWKLVVQVQDDDGSTATQQVFDLRV